MADDPVAHEGEAELTSAPSGRRRRALVIAAAVALVAVLGSVAAYFVLHTSHGKGEEVAVAAGSYVDVPPLLINLRSSDGAARLIKLHLMLVPASADKSAAVTARLPLIIDRFQPFLRELRPEDLAGSAAIFRIKEELLLRANGVAGSGAVTDILIQDLIQQ